MSSYDYRSPEAVLEELRKVRAKACSLRLRWSAAVQTEVHARQEMDEAENHIDRLLEELEFQASTEPTQEER